MEKYEKLGERSDMIMRDLKVVKKDGSVEPFSMVKLIESCRSMGVSDELAEKIAQKVADELYKVESSRIRELIIKILKKIDPELAKKKIQYDIRKRERESFIPTP
jgi:2-phosphoglycerate kinase